ncbi:protein odr-4 homolog [Onthophagus taurus]|uniref:protein odr-4 homolog n=1 Tax=Onthophagus taurus TaxID=166361 RepID=UPI0039BDE30D
MVHNAVAEDSLLEYIQKLAKPDTCTVGLVLGQPSSTKDYIIHFAKTPPCEEDSKSNIKLKEIKSINDVFDVWVADHAKHATRMLPGGMYVLGIFVVSNEDLLTPFSNKLKSILQQVHRQLSANSYMHGTSTKSEKLVLNYCTKTQSYSCKSYDVVNSSVKPAEIKFLSKPIGWRQFQCKYELDRIYSIPIDKSDLTLRRHMNDIIEKTSDCLKPAIFAFDGEIRKNDAALESMDKKIGKSSGGNDHAGPTMVSIYLPCEIYKTTKPIDMSNCAGHIKLTGQIASNVWMHSKATVKDVCDAILEDIIRSLAARLDMHWDSLIEEEHGSPEDTNSIHEPPRRVFIHLPHTEVTLSDYLFPGEGPQDAQISLQELLDITVDEKDGVTDIEGQADLVDVYSNSIESDDTEGSLKSIQTDANKLMYSLGIGIALLVLLISLVVHYFRFIP